MKKNLPICLMALFAFSLNAQTTFNNIDSVQYYIVPACVDSVFIQTWGAQGGNAVDKLNQTTGGKGGYAEGVLNVNPGDTLYVYVGGAGDSTTGLGGYNGGGDGGYGSPGSSCFGGNAGGGGGASDVRYGGDSLINRVIVAAGGGGAGRDYCNGSCQPCGCGGTSGGAGGLTGLDGQAAYNCGFGYPGQGVNNGKGATQSAGGTGGPQDNGNTNVGTDGTLGQGGNGSGGSYDVAGGGGGGGYYGGGGGGGAANGSGVGGGGAGGGSSYIGGVANGATVSDTSFGDGMIIITDIGGISISVTATPNDTVCEGTQVTLTGSGADLYSWDNSVTNGIPFTITTSTTYTLVATDTVGNCSDSLTYNITVLPNPDATIGFTNLGLGYSFTNGENAGETWAWDFGDGDTAQTQNPSHVYSTPGQYVVCLTVTDTNGCSSTSCDTIDAEFPAGIGTYGDNSSINVYPNPANKTLNIEMGDSNIKTVQLLTIEGKSIEIVSKQNGNVTSIQLPVLNSGNYVIKITSDKNVYHKYVTIQQ